MKDHQALQVYKRVRCLPRRRRAVGLRGRLRRSLIYLLIDHIPEILWAEQRDYRLGLEQLRANSVRLRPSRIDTLRKRTVSCATASENLEARSAETSIPEVADIGRE